MGNSSSSQSSPTTQAMAQNVISQPRSLGSNTTSVTARRSHSSRNSSAPRPPEDDGSPAPPPYTPTAELQPPPVPPHDLRRASSAAAPAPAPAPPPRPHRRTASHSHTPRPPRPDRTFVASPVDVRAPSDGVAQLRPPGSHFTRTNSTAARSQDAISTRTNSSTHATLRPSGQTASQTPARPASSHQHVSDTRTPARRNSKENPLDLLRKFNTVIIVDDSSSMEGALWHEARDALAGIAEAASQYDANGIDLHFLNDLRVGTNLKVRDPVLNMPA
jgi:hypothetical protein